MRGIWGNRWLPLGHPENDIPLPSGSLDPPRDPKGHMVPNLQSTLYSIYFLMEHQMSNADHTVKKLLEALPSPGQVWGPALPRFTMQPWIRTAFPLHPPHLKTLWFCYLTLPTLKWGRTDFKLASFFFLNFKKKISHWAIFKIQETHTWKTLKRSEFLFLPAALFCLVKSSAAHGKFSNDWLEGGVWVAGFSGDVSLKEQFARSPPLGRELCYTRGVADD